VPDRSDRIALIVAAVLVVVLIAGSGLLLWKRADTLAKERPGSTVAEVKLTPLETPEVVPASEESEPATEAPKVPKKPNGAELGYVKRVKLSGASVSVSYDPAELLIGQEADLYAKRKGLAAAGGWIVANDTHKIKTFRLTGDAEILVADAEGAVTVTMTPDAFRKAITDDPGDPALKKAAFWFFAEGSRISRVEQMPAE
jgi:hypothetical protein